MKHKWNTNMDQKLGKMKYKAQSMTFAPTLEYAKFFQDNILFGLIITYPSKFTYR